MLAVPSARWLAPVRVRAAALRRAPMPMLAAGVPRGRTTIVVVDNPRTDDRRNTQRRGRGDTGSADDDGRAIRVRTARDAGRDGRERPARRREGRRGRRPAARGDAGAVGRGVRGDGQGAGALRVPGVRPRALPRVAQARRPAGVRRPPGVRRHRDGVRAAVSLRGERTGDAAGLHRRDAGPGVRGPGQRRGDEGHHRGRPHGGRQRAHPLVHPRAHRGDAEGARVDERERHRGHRPVRRRRHARRGRPAGRADGRGPRRHGRRRHRRDRDGRGVPGRRQRRRRRRRRGHRRRARPGPGHLHEGEGGPAGGHRATRPARGRRDGRVVRRGARPAHPASDGVRPGRLLTAILWPATPPVWRANFIYRRNVSDNTLRLDSPVSRLKKPRRRIAQRPSAPTSMQAEPPNDDTDAIIAENGQRFPADVYEETDRACYDSQHECVTAWAAGKLPTHNPDRETCKLYSSDNYRAFQKPDGSGHVVHYHVTEWIRTRDGHIVGNTECYGRGWAHCSTPSTDAVPFDERYYLPLSTMTRRELPSYFDIVHIEDLDDFDVEDPVYDYLVTFADDTTVAANREDVTAPLDDADLNEMFASPEAQEVAE